MHAFEQPAVLVIEPELAAPFVQRADAREQARMQHDRVAVSGQSRRHRALATRNSLSGTAPVLNCWTSGGGLLAQWAIRMRTQLFVQVAQLQQHVDAALRGLEQLRTARRQVMRWCSRTQRKPVLVGARLGLQAIASPRAS